MRKYMIGMVMGILFSLIAIAPMVISKVDWLHILVAFVTWGITGLFIVAADFWINPILKGLIIAFLVSLPMLLVNLPDTARFTPFIIYHDCPAWTHAGFLAREN